MIEDCALFRPQVSASLGTCEASAGWVFVELCTTALCTLRIRKSCSEKEPKTRFIVGECLFEVENGEALSFHACSLFLLFLAVKG